MSTYDIYFANLFMSRIHLCFFASLIFSGINSHSPQVSFKSQSDIAGETLSSATVCPV